MGRFSPEVGRESWTRIHFAAALRHPTKRLRIPAQAGRPPPWRAVVPLRLLRGIVRKRPRVRTPTLRTVLAATACCYLTVPCPRQWRESLPLAGIRFRLAAPRGLLGTPLLRRRLCLRVRTISFKTHQLLTLVTASCQHGIFLADAIAQSMA